MRRAQRRYERERAAPDARRQKAAVSWVEQLQRTAGNRAVGRLLRAPAGISVHEGSTLSAADFAAKLKKNKKVPDWIKQAVGSSGGSLTMGKLAPPSGRIWLFDDSLAAAFKSGNWEMTTAKSKIEVKDDGGERKWRQIVTPDLAKGERIGFYMKTGPGEKAFSPSPLHSESAEIIYGWTQPDTATSKREAKKGLVVIVTEIEVTRPDGRRKIFKPGPDQMAEAIIHEIGIHAGRIAMGKPDVHSDTDSSVADVVEQIGGFFRPERTGGGLEISPLTKEIFAFVGGRK
jgi:hypothetical protein